MIISYQYRRARLHENRVIVRMMVTRDGGTPQLHGIFWMTPEDWEEWKNWQSIAAATFAMTRADVAAGVDVQVYFVDITSRASSEVSP